MSLPRSDQIIRPEDWLPRAENHIQMAAVESDVAAVIREATMEIADYLADEFGLELEESIEAAGEIASILDEAEKQWTAAIGRQIN